MCVCVCVCVRLWVYVCQCICLLGFYGIPTFESYLKPNPFLYKETVLFQIIQFSCKKFLFQVIQFSKTVLIKTTQFIISWVFVYKQLNDKTVLFQTIQFSVEQFQCQKQFYFKQFSLPYKNSSLFK